ncbi:MAG TPA: LysM peptidoglycan-binding domain-containing protein [Bacteroidetes bacterium]|nr:LysM peptidoglycan-binding domain-containing protein [Bacteroidota bacterium]
MMKRTILLIVPVAVLSGCSGTRRASHIPPSIDRTAYIEQYKDLAIREMRRSGIPASITMAQALLESDNGNSRLAREANNHFGIKCHRDWQGRRIYHDDDARNECFRKYKTVYESYRDHSDFLRTGSRYRFLFNLSPGDYKAWAKGLKQAGYATHRHYDELLIRIIEENNLHLLDEGISVALENKPSGPVGQEQSMQEIPREEQYEFTVNLRSREVMQNNRIDYVIAEEGDTYPDLAREFDLMPWEIYRYNEIPRTAKPEPGQIVYLQPKRNRAEAGYETHVVLEGETMYGISQRYGIKLSRLYRMNGLEEGVEPEPGTELYLRVKSGIFGGLF